MCETPPWAPCASCTASPASPSTSPSARVTRSSTSSVPCPNAAACRWCAPSAGGRPCTSPRSASCSWQVKTTARCRTTSAAPAWPATPATASPTRPVSSANWPRCAPTASRATTRSWNWVCAASPPASATIQATWWPACPFRPRPTSCRTAGLNSCAARRPRSRLRSATTPGHGSKHQGHAGPPHPNPPMKKAPEGASRTVRGLSLRSP